MEIAAATIGITEVVVRSTSKLWTLTGAWRDAPTDLHHLRDELAHTETFLEEVQQNLDSAALRGLLQGSQQELDRLIGSGTDVLRRIEAVVDDLLAGGDGVHASTRSSKQPLEDLGKRRKLLWLRRSHRVLRWRKEMRAIRASICQLLISHQVSLSRRVKDEVSDLPLSLQASHDTMAFRIQDRLQAMEERMLVAIQQGHSAFPDESHTEARQGDEPPSGISTTAPSLPIPFRVEPLVRRASFCDMTCICPCHRASRASTVVALLRSVMGVLAVSYAARGFQSCTNPSCHDFQRRQQPLRDIHIIYHLPGWLSRISVSTFFSNNLNGGPQLNLRVYHSVSWGDGGQVSEYEVVKLMTQGDTEQFKRALREGRVSVRAAYGNLARPLLAFTLKLRSAPIAKLLLQAGADPFQVIGTEQSGRSVTAWAFQLFINGDPADLEVVKLFPISQYIEEMDLPPLHLSILGITHVSESAMLQNPHYMCDIDRKAGDLGYTPLHLATMRGNTAAVELLLRAGAEVNIGMESGSTPLMFASLNGHCDIVEALLRGGADVNGPDTHGRTPLHAAAAGIGGGKHALRIVSLLLEHGADANARDSQTQCTPLFWAASGGAQSEIFELLLKHGADPDALDGVGASAILFAITMSNRDACRILVPRVRRGTLLAATQDGHCVVHKLAISGDAEMMGIFTDHAERIRGPGSSASLHAPDVDGKTPAQLLSERKPSKEIRAAFERLLEAVEEEDTKSTTPPCPDADVELDDEFFDAEEEVLLEKHEEKVMN